MPQRDPSPKFLQRPNVQLHVPLPNVIESGGFGENLPGEICCCGPPLFCRSIACVLALPVHNQGKSTATPLSLTKPFKCKSFKSGKLRKLMSTLGYQLLLRRSCASVPRHHITTETRNGKVIQPTDKLPKSPELLHQHSKQKLRTTTKNHQDQ